MYRKDFTQLSSEEKDKLVDAFNELHKEGTIDDYVALHRDNFGAGIHWGPAFLPWHRDFLRKLELALQEVHSSVTLPYWDWTRGDSRNLDAEPWKSFFGGRQGRGRFAWECTRSPTPNGSLPSLSDIISELSATNYFDLRGAIESGSHFPGHTWTGGDMGSVESPKDPLFYLHHCNIDRLWAIWQQNNPDVDQYSTTTGHSSDSVPAAAVPLNSPMIGGATPASMLDHTKLGYLYERDILLEIAWHQAKGRALLTGDRRSADLFVRDSDADSGEYPSSGAHWQSPDIWVRNNAPGEPGENPDEGHQAPIVDAVNYMYVNVHNRGSERAENISVEAFHCNPATTMLWPNHFVSMGKFTLPGGVDADASERVGPFLWTPDVEDHECLLAVVDSPDDPTTTPMFHTSVPHWQLVRFDNSVGQRNVSPIRVAIGGRMRSQMKMRGGLRRSTNRLELNAGALPGDTNLRLKVANSIARNAELTALEEIDNNPRFATLQMQGGDVAVIDGFELAAFEDRNVKLEVDFSLEAEHEQQYPLIATQIQDGEIAGKLTIEFTAIKDPEDYVFGNPRSRELHTVSCPYWFQISPKNKVPFPTVQEGIARGYNGCRFCLPEHDTG